jgi:glutaredoxin 3
MLSHLEKRRCSAATATCLLDGGDAAARHRRTCSNHLLALLLRPMAHYVSLGGGFCRPQDTLDNETAMPPVTIYTTSLCPYCHMAKRLLIGKGVHFTEINAGPADVRAALRVKSGGLTSVPQIWIGDQHVGGCDDLHALDDSGELDALLAG